MKAADEATLDTRLAELEPVVLRGQLNAAIKRLEQVFDRTVARDGLQAGRRLVELIHLVGGDRRIKVLEPHPARRVDD